MFHIEIKNIDDVWELASIHTASGDAQEQRQRFIINGTDPERIRITEV